MRFDQENTEEIDLEIERHTVIIITQSAIIEKIGYWLVKHTNTQNMLLDLLLQAKRTITGVHIIKSCICNGPNYRGRVEGVAVISSIVLCVWR